MKKEYRTPAMKVVAVKVERTMCQCSQTLGIHIDDSAYDGQKAWSKEYDDEFDW